MVKFSDFVSGKEINEGKDTELASLNVSNNERIYNVAMKAHNSTDLKKAMLKMKLKFPDENKIDFNKVDWEEIFVDLNERDASLSNLVSEALKEEEITESIFNKFMDILMPKEEIKDPAFEDKIKAMMIDSVDKLSGISQESKKEMIKKLSKM